MHCWKAVVVVGIVGTLSLDLPVLDPSGTLVGISVGSLFGIFVGGLFAIPVGGLFAIPVDDQFGIFVGSLVGTPAGGLFGISVGSWVGILVGDLFGIPVGGLVENPEDGGRVGMHLETSAVGTLAACPMLV